MIRNADHISLTVADYDIKFDAPCLVWSVPINFTLSCIPDQDTVMVIYMYLLDKPEVISSSLSPYRVNEGQTATLICTVTAANPNTSITWKWCKTDSPNTILYHEPNYTIPNIQRGRTGSFSCTASNSVGTSEAAVIIVEVQCM